LSHQATPVFQVSDSAAAEAFSCAGLGFRVEFACAKGVETAP